MELLEESNLMDRALNTLRLLNRERSLLPMASLGMPERVLAGLMEEKERLEDRLSQLRVRQMRLKGGFGPSCAEEPGDLEAEGQELRARLQALDSEIAPLARAAGELAHPRWGLLTRAGNDKSLLARQVERYADVYTSRVSNFLRATPFVYLRSSRGSLPHDPGAPGGPPLAPRLGD